VCIIIKSDFTVLRVCCISFGFTTTVCRAKCNSYCLVSRLFDCPLFMNQDAEGISCLRLDTFSISCIMEKFIFFKHVYRLNSVIWSVNLRNDSTALITLINNSFFSICFYCVSWVFITHFRKAIFFYATHITEIF